MAAQDIAELLDARRNSEAKEPDGDKQTVSTPIDAHVNPKTFEEPAVPTAVAEDVPAVCGPAGPKRIQKGK